MPFPSIKAALSRLPRNTSWAVAAVLLLAAIGNFSPVQLPVVLYKTSLIALAAVLGYWLDRALFPYARPDSYLTADWKDAKKGAPEASYDDEWQNPGGDFKQVWALGEKKSPVDHPVVWDYRWIFAAALLRRAVVVGAVVMGIAQGM